MNKPDRYVVNPDVSCREEGSDGVLLFNPDTDDVIVVNTTGTLIWQALAQPRTRPEIVALLLAQCEGAPDEAQVARDVDEFVDAMVQRGFIGLYEGLVT